MILFENITVTSSTLFISSKVNIEFNADILYSLLTVSHTEEVEKASVYQEK